MTVPSLYLSLTRTCSSVLYPPPATDRKLDSFSPQRRDRGRTRFMAHFFVFPKAKKTVLLATLNQSDVSMCSAIPCHPFHASQPTPTMSVFPQGQPDVGADTKLARFQRCDIKILQLALPEIYLNLNPLRKSITMSHLCCPDSSLLDMNPHRRAPQSLSTLTALPCIPHFTHSRFLPKAWTPRPITHPDTDSTPTGDRKQKFRKSPKKDF